MKTLDEIKDEVARENRKPNWDELLYWGSSSSGFDYPELIDEVAKRYAEQALDECIANPSDMFLVSYDTINEIKNQLK